MKKTKTKTKTQVKTKAKVTAKAKSKTKLKAKPNLLAELTQRKMEALKSGESTEAFGKFKPNKPRNVNNSNVGPSWGKRKGN